MSPVAVMAVMSSLEKRYRWLLGLLPRSYRVAHEDEMVAAFLDDRYSVEPDNFDLALRYGAPSWADRRSVAALALRLRLSNPSSMVYRIRAAAFRRALLGLLTLACAMSMLEIISRVTFGIWSLTAVDDASSIIGPLQALQSVGLWQGVMRWAFVVWVPVLFLALHGGRAALSVAAVLTGVAAVADTVALTTGPEGAVADQPGRHHDR